MLGGLFNFSPASPDIVALFFQDYNGAITRDGGRTWTYLNVSGKGWGGYCYGGYTPDGTVLFGGDAPSWYGPRQLRVSLDAGQTWRLATDAAGKPIVFAGPDVAYSDPRNADVCFASNWRSDDRGRTWQPMSGCDGVFTSSPAADHALLGRRDKLAVKSTDGGATWTPVTGEAPAKITDVAYDPKLDRVFAACDWKLFASDAGGPWREVATPRDQFGGVRVMTVCVDPADPSVVYAGGPAHTYMSSATIARSTDAGRTWTNLTTGTGPNEVQAVRVHPVTREAWVNGQCFGMWKIGPPGK
jgi:hypothetical protein